MYSNRRPYYGLKMSVADFFREPVRYLKQSLQQESMLEKPYYQGEYPKMHLTLPTYKYQPKKRTTPFGDIPGRYVTMTFGDVDCHWEVFRGGDCMEGPEIITLEADYFFMTEFNFIAQIIEDTTSGVVMETLPPEEYSIGDHQSYRIIFPENAEGTVVICGFASTNALISTTFEMTVAGMPIIANAGGGASIGTSSVNPIKSVTPAYGNKGADCGCIELVSSCDPCAAVDAVSWDSDISATTIDREDEVTIAVKDGYGPFNWEVSGTGFSLGAAQTVERTNTLISDDTACGVASISVTDFCEGSTSGEVVCTTGTWITDFSISLPQPSGWNGVESCYSFCDGADYIGQWGTGSNIYKYFDSTHRVLFQGGQGGWCFGSGCSDFSVTNTYDDSYEVTTEEIILLIADFESCPHGCLKDWGIHGQRWDCA